MGGGAQGVDLLYGGGGGVHPCWPWSTEVQGGCKKIKYRNMAQFPCPWFFLI